MAGSLQDKIEERSILLLTGSPHTLAVARRSSQLADLIEIDQHTLATSNINRCDQEIDQPQLLYFGGYGFADELMVTELGAAKKSSALSFDRVLKAEGGFCAIFANERELRISTDIFGMFGLYYAFGKDYAVVGTRFYDVVRALKAIGVPLSLDERAVASTLMPIGRFFEQATSPRTFSEEIKFLPVGHAIVFSKGTASLKNIGVIERIRDGNGATYAELLREGAKGVARHVLAAFNQSHAMLGMGLSGGYDSRVLLAAMLHLGLENHDRVYIDSKIQPRHVDDLRVAKRIAGYYGFEVNRRYPSAHHFARFGRRIERLDPASAIDEFRRTHGPNYHIAFLQELAYSDWTLSTRLTGGGGEIYRDFYKQDFPQPNVTTFVRNLTELSHKAVVPECRELAAATVFDELRRLDPEPEEWRSLRLHYTAWRNRMHFGRVEALHRPVVNPLMNVHLAMASNMFPDGDGERQLLLDLFMLLEPTLAFMEFDQRDKAFTKSEIEATPFFADPLERPSTSPLAFDGNDLAAVDDKESVESFSLAWVNEAADLLYQQTEEAGEYLMDSSLRPLLDDRYVHYALGSALRTDRALPTRFRQGTKILAVVDALQAIKG